MDTLTQVCAGGAVAVLLVREFTAYSRSSRVEAEMRTMREAVALQQESLGKITVALERITLVLEYMRQDIRTEKKG